MRIVKRATFPGVPFGHPGLFSWGRSAVREGHPSYTSILHRWHPVGVRILEWATFPGVPFGHPGLFSWDRFAVLSSRESDPFPYGALAVKQQSPITPVRDCAPGARLKN